MNTAINATGPSILVSASLPMALPRRPISSHTSISNFEMFPGHPMAPCMPMGYQTIPWSDILCVLGSVLAFPLAWPIPGGSGPRWKGGDHALLPLSLCLGSPCAHADAHSGLPAGDGANVPMETSTSLPPPLSSPASRCTARASHNPAASPGCQVLPLRTPSVHNDTHWAFYDP